MKAQTKATIFGIAAFFVLIILTGTPDENTTVLDFLLWIGTGLGVAAILATLAHYYDKKAADENPGK